MSSRRSLDPFAIADRDPLSSKLKAMRQILLDALLPNRAWWSRVRDLKDPRIKVAYWALRFGIAVLVITVISTFAIRQHPQLR